MFHSSDIVSDLGSEVIWLNTSPNLNCLAQPLLEYLSQRVAVTQWDYSPELDKANSLEEAIRLLHRSLSCLRQSVHLVGHGTAGLLGLLYARQYPDRLKSLTLLAVGTDAAIDWQAHYYRHRPFLNRQKLLSAMAYNLFGHQILGAPDEVILQRLTGLLEADLECSLSPHSLFQQLNVPVSRVPVPLLVCGSQDDIIVEPEALQAWTPWLKESDRLWVCPEGQHFFHFSQATLVAEQVLSFWSFLASDRLSLLRTELLKMGL
jgi:pimeloyl-ACP methyl ester carboxylesterase